MNDLQALTYVKASGAALGLPLDEARAKRVAVYLQLTGYFAQQLEAVPIAPETEPAQLFIPAPFPDIEAPMPALGS